MTRFVFRAVALLGIVGGGVMLTAQATSPVMTVQRDPGCGCCMNWVAHLKRAGFKVTVSESPDMQVIKDTKGIPRSLRSCHTGVVDGYVVEGHVPADDVRRMLKERPAIVGIAVPGMPAGSPGMETGGTRDPYDVVAFDKDRKVRVFASHR